MKIAMIATIRVRDAMIEAIRACIVHAIFLAIFVASLDAQSRRPFVGGGAVVSAQRAPAPADGSPNNRSPTIGGAAAGVIATGGVALTSVVSVAGELVVPGRIEAFQTFNHHYVRGYHTKHRDITVSALVNVGGGSRRVRVEGVSGISLVRIDTLESGTRFGSFGDQVASLVPYGEFEQVGRMGWGMVFGNDVAMRVGNAVSIVPQFRLHYIRRTYEERLNGLPRFVIRFGAGIRVGL
jgi:hypothetical protein